MYLLLASAVNVSHLQCAQIEIDHKSRLFEFCWRLQKLSLTRDRLLSRGRYRNNNYYNATTCVTMTTADGREVMAICGEEANGQFALGGKEIKGDAMSLQEAFLQFRRKKQVIKSKNTGQGMIIDHVLSLFVFQDELRERLAMEQQAARQRRDPLHMETLRKMFLDRALEYVGVPYAQRYHPPECTYHFCISQCAGVNCFNNLLCWLQHRHTMLSYFLTAVG